MYVKSKQEGDEPRTISGVLLALNQDTDKRAYLSLGRKPIEESARESECILLPIREISISKSCVVKSIAEREGARKKKNKTTKLRAPTCDS